MEVETWVVAMLETEIWVAASLDEVISGADVSEVVVLAEEREAEEQGVVALEVA